MSHGTFSKHPLSPRSPALVQAIRRTLTPSAYVAGGLLAVSLAGLASASLALELSDLDGANGFTINGINAYDNSGRSVSGAGDINGDGIEDLIIGASGADPNGRSNAGQSYVVFGNRQGFPAVRYLDDLNGRNGFAINGIQAGDGSGYSVSGAGDVNGDGIADVIIGAPWAHPNGRNYAGQSYVVFGTQAGFPATLELSDLDGRNGFAINGIQHHASSGWSVSGAGDVNGDGIDDLFIGAPFALLNDRQPGQSYVVFGTHTGFPVTLELSDLDGRNGFKINGIAWDRSGYSVSGAGDVNGDGIADMIIGAHDANPNGRQSGQSYVVFGTQAGFPATLELVELDGRNGFMINGINAYDYSGRSVSGAGDVNGDGIDDLLIGAPGAVYGSGVGQSYVVFGNRRGFPAILELEDLDGGNGFMLNGVNAYDGSSHSVSGAGDINGDGIADVIISAGRQNYVVFGAQEDFPAVLELASLDSGRGLVINGSGSPVSGAGDINGDGIADLIIGASLASPNGRQSGQSYVVFGEGPVTTVAIDIRPGTMLNRINPGHQDRLPVAILGTGSLDVTQVDPTTVRFGPDQAQDIAERRWITDINGNGNLDLVLRFRVLDTGLICGDTEATLTGMTFTGEALRGTDSLRTVGCQTVAIDIRPGTTPNYINPRSQGHFPVAILSTPAFDATQIDPATVRFGPARTQDIAERRRITDIDGDGDADLVLYFRIRETGIQCGAIRATLAGVTFTSQAIIGSDRIQTVGCE